MIRACSLAELLPGQMHRMDTDPAITVFHTEDGELFAVDDTCTHEDASLADGWLEGCVVECPMHASRFDLRTGEPDAPPATQPIRTHQVSVSDGDVYVAVSPAAPTAQPGAVHHGGP